MRASGRIIRLLVVCADCMKEFTGVALSAALHAVSSSLLFQMQHLLST